MNNQYVEVIPTSILDDRNWIEEELDDALTLITKREAGIEDQEDYMEGS